MKITDVEAIVLDTGKDYPDPSVAAEAHGVRFVALLKISTDEGITGWSDIETQPHVGKAIVEAPSGGQIGFESLRAALVGEDPLEHERLWQKMYRYLGYYGRQGAGMHMLSGADIALWDIAGKACEQPICKLLGAKYRSQVKAYASTLFRPTPDAMQHAVAGYLEQGFRAIKFGWGAFGHDLKLDVRLVKAARAEAGPEVDLMVDGGWYGIGYADPYRPRAVKDWIRLVDELEAADIFWLEDFLHPENFGGYAEVSQATPHAAHRGWGAIVRLHGVRTAGRGRPRSYAPTGSLALRRSQRRPPDRRPDPAARYRLCPPCLADGSAQGGIAAPERLSDELALSRIQRFVSLPAEQSLHGANQHGGWLHTCAGRTRPGCDCGRGNGCQIPGGVMDTLAASLDFAPDGKLERLCLAGSPNLLHEWAWDVDLGGKTFRPAGWDECFPTIDPCPGQSGDGRSDRSAAGTDLAGRERGASLAQHRLRSPTVLLAGISFLSGGVFSSDQLAGRAP
jgi:L-alanine-DL-glutamate epimerase-like enolase superfamily enzyme